MTVPAFAKVNLGLEVLHRRKDGYHELRTLFQSIELHDDLVLRPRRRDVVVRCDHPAVPSGERNLALRAALALRRFGPAAQTASQPTPAFFSAYPASRR